MTASTSKGLHLGLWVVQVLLALGFLFGGALKVVSAPEQLAAQMPWVTGAMGQFLRLIGVTEVLGAIGLVVPAATRIKPVLTPIAACGLLTIMVLAAITHAVRGEYPGIGINAVYGALLGFIIWGRFVKAPIQAR